MVALKLPLDFERRESVRLLARKIGAISPTWVESPGFVLATALRIWMDWASAAKEFRPLRCRLTNDNAQVDWTKEDLTYVLEGVCAWTGNSGELMKATLDAGFIQLERRGEQHGLILSDFWPLNQHLSPDYKTIQSRGGQARAAARFRDESARAAKDRQRIFDQQGTLPFGSTETTPEERELCYAVFIRMYRVCGLDIPTGDKFTESTMREALNVVREFTPEEIQAVEEFLLVNRDTPEVVKIPERILQNFRNYVNVAST